MIFVREASAPVVLVTLTLSLQCAGMAAVIAWARPQFRTRRSRVGGDPFRHARDAIDDRVHWVARTRDSALGRVLSLALLSSMGICLLLLVKRHPHADRD